MSETAFFVALSIPVVCGLIGFLTHHLYRERDTMLISPQTQIQVRAMLNRLPRERVLDLLDVKESVLIAALNGEEIEVWDVHNIKDGVDLWEAGTDDN